MSVPSLLRDISPPRSLKRRKTSHRSLPTQKDTPIFTSSKPALAAVEAGKIRINDHLEYFKDHLSKASRDTHPYIPRLAIEDFAALYQRNQHQHGSHLVIHQHNHPKAGVHYNLRLQFSESSSISFAVPKGLPGNVNSRSVGRMAIETRVHNFWNHLIESASSKRGSLLIWDTGTYTVLPRYDKKREGILSPHTTDDESESDGTSTPVLLNEILADNEHENKKLVDSFQTRYIRLRLHGCWLSQNYTIILRLPSNQMIQRPTARRRSQKKSRSHPTNSTDSEDGYDAVSKENDLEQDLDTDTDEDADTRLYNAYPGSTNDIGSIHQRHWFLMLDRHNSGFALDRSGGGKGKWVKRSENEGFEPFIVRGRDFERSVVTGRLAREVESDEGVEDFVGRGGWVGIEH